MAIVNSLSIYFVTTLVLHITVVKSIVPPSQKIGADEAPFVVFLLSGNSYCTGVILNERIVLTAGHCINGNMEVTAGRSSIFNNTNAQTINVQKALTHESFLIDANGIQAFYDISLLLLQTPLTFNQYVQPIQLTNHIDYEKPSTVYGWGSVDAIRRTPFLYLRAKNVSLIPDNLCIEMLSKAVTQCTKQEYELCAQKGVCHGDSGGPLVQTVDNATKLIGILSWGADDNVNCDTDPAVYENVGYFSQWIDNGIRDLLDVNVTARAYFSKLTTKVLHFLKNRKDS